jgi:hypothetical protein
MNFAHFFFSDVASSVHGLRQALLASFQRQMLAQAMLCSPPLPHSSSSGGESNVGEEDEENGQKQGGEGEDEQPAMKRAKFEQPEMNNEHGEEMAPSQMNGTQLAHLNELLVARGFQLPPGGLAALPSGKLLRG